MSEELLIIFVRNPELGKVKTRLAKDVGDETALAIYTFLLERTKSITSGLKQEKQVHYSDEIATDDLWQDFGYHKRIQADGDLGEKMQSAFEQGFEAGFKRIVIIGSDLYDLESEDIVKAFEQLKQHDVVLGPAQDGGYYLLGMCQMVPGIFANKTWGTDQVLDQTLADLDEHSVCLLSERNDADYLSDIIDIPVFQPFLKHIKHD
ncbi:TIGR04282 family arsenosugar biosynthesis glycosyltransferase [Aureitalea marina]|uniref:Glycosyltransferase n=1 Tax=Aureitalea marina TaxID=930804 RepID=A0A2S7KLM3_9FLAO|nr:TIGR04282 family arsenosugar biosynthesis glycosyltransferase [Aureitalea marina]PQB03526.1 glycosyltransferase [Aureitalea marina]